MYRNMDKVIIDINKIVSDLKELFDKLIIKLSSNNLKDKSLEGLVELYSNDKDFCNDLEKMKYSFNEIASILESSDIFSEEYFDFLSIKNMCNYIINDVKLYILHSSFISSILFNFFKLIRSKIDDKDSCYSDMYLTFEKFLDKQERTFYLKIYEGTHEYDDLIDEVTCILGE